MCDRSQREFRRRAARFVASDGDSRTKNVVPTNPSLVADLTYCREAMWCRGNIRMGRYSGCVDRPIADRAPAWLQPIVEGAFAASLAGLRSCLREGACAISGMRYIAARRSRGGSSSSRVLTRGIRWRRRGDPGVPRRNGPDRCSNRHYFYIPGTRALST